jgi:hypothetical protein
MMRCFMESMGNENSFSATWLSIKLLGRSCSCVVLSRRMALESYNLPFRLLKGRLCWRRWRNDSWCRRAMQFHYLHPGHRKKRLVRSSLSDILSRRMVLRSHNLPSERLKMRLCWFGWSIVSWCRKAIWTNWNHFLHPGHRKKGHKRCRLIDVWSRRMALRNHYLLLNVLKSNFGDVDEAMFHDVVKQLEPIFYILGPGKSELYEFAEMMF